MKNQGPRESSLVELRRMAVRILAEVIQGKKTVEDALLYVTTKNTSRTLAAFDRSWLVEVVSGVLRYRGRVDYVIDTYALKKKPTGPLRRYLQTAVYQLLSDSEVEPALVVSETVQAIRINEGDPPSKFANAILRKVAQAQEQWRNWSLNPQSTRAEQVAWCSLPEWLFDSLKKDYGTEWTLQFARANLERPKTWYRDLTTNQSLELPGGFQGNEPRGYVQDISNQDLVASVLTRIREHFSAKKDLKILDLCSAPGGKSLGLAAAGYSVLATDIDPQRLQRVQENTNRLGFQNQIRISSYESIANSSELYDVIWIDAPCSSTGVLRRHPEARWNREMLQVQRWVETQNQLIDWGKNHLKPSGLLVYSTCSVLKIENRGQVPGLVALEAFERFPQDPPDGDGIYAVFFSSFQ